MSTALTIGETLQELHNALRDYIEATYHISNPFLVAQRRELLEQVGVIHQQPYLESTPRYRPGALLRDLGLDEAALEVLTALSLADGERRVLVHDPPYQHQALAIQHSLRDGHSLMVMTGTGSGKTECFLLPILGKLAREARGQGARFGETPAVRALVLYPMNALVNDQLGRLRLMFGDPRVVDRFMRWTGRPARFARYTSRTLYPGVRNETKDQDRLSPVGKFYVENLETAAGAPSSKQEAAARLVEELQRRGKWPAKPDLVEWYGKKGTRWRDPKTGAFKRCVTLPADPELFTRHEVHEAPPDVLVTNYSMLEYMLMRPLERPVFDRTREWLRNNPRERFLLVIDEAHLYRGASGAEVALLVRRLRMRLGIEPERLQVICTSASFHNAAYAVQFGAQLTGKDVSDFRTVTGALDLREPAAVGRRADADALAAVDIAKFYHAESDDSRVAEIAPFLEYRGVPRPWHLERSLHKALSGFPPLALLTNLTMKEALPISDLARTVFGQIDPAVGSRAVTALLALASVARRSSSEPGMLPCRVHSFHRGLPGLWVCMDPDCAAVPAEQRGGPCGKLFGQPRELCECGARVLEFFTCRHCGTAYARAYTPDMGDPSFLWSEPGGAFRTLAGDFAALDPIDLLLEQPVLRETVEPAEYDLLSGRLNPKHVSDRNRQVFIRSNRTQRPSDEDGHPVAGAGEFRPCAVCGGHASYGRSSVQDHQTKGDQPFQALIAKQIQVQPPGPVPATKLAPLRGRKVLVFSDSRQTAARLAPNLQTYSTQDAMRPLIVAGFARLQRCATVAPLLSLEDLYLGVLIAATEMGVRLRPELKPGEGFQDEAVVAEAVRRGSLDRDAEVMQLVRRLSRSTPPEALVWAIVNSLTDRYYGLESLALASIVECADQSAAITALPDVPGCATSPDQKLALARSWIGCWTGPKPWLTWMPAAWWNLHVQPHSGKFQDMQRLLGEKAARQVFDKEWLPKLLAAFCEQLAPGKHRVRGRELTLQLDGQWVYCQACRTTQRPFPGRAVCVNCGREACKPIDPHTDPVFVARKGYYRASTVNALRTPSVAPMALIAAEHTAQLNTAQAEDVFSKAEEHELLFQDVALGVDATDRPRPAIDVLSCTTTMEVGIDIGTLSGVSLRNMPPARANYQQRAGRAGRRGNAVATVTAFGSADSHDEHYFTQPDQMIRGPVDDPTLTLDNPDIARRHVTAYLLQRYHQEVLPEVRPEDQPHLFAVLGTVSEFRNAASTLSRSGFEEWLRENERALKNEVRAWLPAEISQSDRDHMVEHLVNETLTPIDDAIDYVAGGPPGKEEPEPQGPADPAGTEAPDEAGEERPVRSPASENLLDRLLYKGVLPRYAFPTDVATFHVFNPDRSTGFRPAFHFTPSQGLAVALSEYAPGKQVWIGGRLWTSGAIYSPIREDRFKAWNSRQWYYECKRCHYAHTCSLDKGTRRETKDCVACGGEGTFGPATYWLRPPGFAHPVSIDVGTTPDDQPARSYATRAKLTMPTPSDEARWTRLNDRLRVFFTRQHLLVTNRGPLEEGYTYCGQCGLIEPSAIQNGKVSGAHPKPYPDSRQPNCPGGRATTGLVLGTDFISDVLLISLSVAAPMLLVPGLLATSVALRTVSEAITRAACLRLELEPNELQAEYRPALTAAGRDGREAEIYLYDTLPGGAGFSQRVGQLGLTVFKDALKILEHCPAECDRSCYRCLRSYKNKFEHDLLDRQLGATLLRFTLTGEQPMLDPARAEISTDLLFHDLKRQGIEGLEIERNAHVPNASIAAPILIVNRVGERCVVCVHGSLTPNTPPDDRLREFERGHDSARLLLIDELLVRRNLPRATASLLDEVR